MNFISIIYHINKDCYGCSGEIEDGKRIISVMKEAASYVGAKVIGSEFKKYPITGLTAIAFFGRISHNDCNIPRI